MTGQRKVSRHQEVRTAILDAAWTLARERGLGSWSLRDVGAAVGMRAPSLYGYFPNKAAIYDAMFAMGYTALLERIDKARRGQSAKDSVRRAAHLFFDFCVEDPARYQLLFLRTVPGFEPSPQSYALATRALEEGAAVLTAAGAGGRNALDLWTALLAGLVSQQVSNDPGGRRWKRLVDRAVDMFLATQAAADQP